MTAVGGGWAHALYPVLRGPRPTGATSLQDLGLGRVVDHLVARFAADHDLAERQAALTVLHVALGTVCDALVVPFVVDRISLRPATDQLAAVLDATGTPNAVWLGSAAADRDGEGLGRHIRALLEPVSAQVAQRARLHPRAVTTVVDDKLRATVHRLLAQDDVTGSWSDAADLLRGTGFAPRVPQRWVEVAADEGDAVRLPVPSVCCVLHVTACESACPACPRHEAGARARRTQEWLRGLDDEGFHEVVGRPRQGRAT